MTAMGNRSRSAALVCGLALVLAGCDSSGEGAATEGTPTSSSVAPNVPAGFDPCTDIPQSVLDSEGLRQKIPDDSEASGGIKWRGCMWVQADGYAVSIQTTNLTIDMVRDKGFRDTQELTIDDRRAITSRRLEDDPETRCTLDVEMQGGSLEFGLSNPASNRKTGHLDSCELVRALAEKVTPTIPEGA